MIVNSSYFIVLEGLDGSGKTTAAKRLVNYINNNTDFQAMFTFEPHDELASGEYIREVLRKTITQIHPFSLALAFATNRLDHNQRVINPWLSKPNRVVISDRYYLSSLAYQVNEHISKQEIMTLNRFVRQPDILFFLDLDDASCYQRMENRNQPKELFESNLKEIRASFEDGIIFLQEILGLKTERIDASGTVDNTVDMIFSKFIKQTSN